MLTRRNREFERPFEASCGLVCYHMVFPYWTAQTQSKFQSVQTSTSEEAMGIW